MSDEISLDDAKSWMWRKGNLSWKIWEQQEPIYKGIRALEKKVGTVVILCARQFGKSHLGVLMAIEDCLRYPNKCVLVMGPTLKQTREIVTPRMRDIAKDAPPGLVRPSKSEGKWYIGESELVIGGFDQNSSSQRGKTVQTIYIEEIVDSNPDDYQESMRSDLGPALTHSDGGKMIFLTTPPKIPDHPFITDTMANAELNNSLYIFTIRDNHKLSAEQVAACVKRCGGEHTVDFRREYLCEIVRDAQVVVVPDYDDVRHVFQFERPLHIIPHITIDFGGVRDRTAAILHWYNFLDNKTEVWDERVFPPNTPTSYMVKAFLEMEAPFGEMRRFADAPGQVQVDLANEGYQTSLPPKSDWQAGVNKLAVTFAADEIRVHERCKFLRQSLKSGTFNKHRTDFERTEALGHCDALAALMYGLRAQDHSNPYPRQTLSRDVYHFIPKETEESAIAGAIQPKVMGGFEPKKFGTFRQ